MFAISRLAGRPLQVSLKCEPELAEQPARELPGDQARLPPEQAPLEHGDARRLLPDGMVADMLEDSYDLVVAGLPRRVRRELGWGPSSRAASVARRVAHHVAAPERPVPVQREPVSERALVSKRRPSIVM